MKNIRHKILMSVDDIGEDMWRDVFGEIPEGYHFYKTLEGSRFEQFQFLYITLQRANETLLIAPLFIGELDFDIVMEGPISAIVRHIRKYIPGFFIERTLFCGAPFGENGIIGIREGIEGAEKERLVALLSGVMDRLCRKKNIGFMVFKDYPDRDAGMLETLKRKSFFKLESLPSVTLDIDFASMDEYFKLLGHSTRKDLKRKLKRSEESGGVRIEETDNADALADEIYDLYLKTYNAGTVKFEKLTKDFFLLAAKNSGGHAKFFLYYVNGRLAAFNLCFVYKDLLIDKFIGFDYDLSYKHNLYFVSWYHNIEWCLKRSIRHYQVGQTDYEPKFNLGGKPMRLYAYARHRNPLANIMLTGVAALLTLQASQRA